MQANMMNTQRLKTLVLSLIIALVISTIAAVSIAGASTETNAAQTDDPSISLDSDIAPIEVLLYKIFRSPDGYAALVGASVSEDTPIPFRFEIAVPAGVELLWFGEISGGPRDDDRTFPKPYDMRTENGLDIYTAISYEHVIQIEYLIEGDPFEALGAGNHVFRLSYTPLQDAAILRLAAYLPENSRVDDPAFTRLGTAAQTGEPLYGITFRDVTGGQNYSVDLYYGPPANVARQGAANLTGGILATIGVVAAGALAFAAMMIVNRRRKAAAEAEAEYDSSWDDDDS